MTRTFQLNDGRTIPVIGWGTASSGLEGGGQRTVDIGLQVVKLGLRQLDTAQFYETEESIGQIVRGSGIPKEQIYITTKVSESSFKTRPPTPENVRASVHESLAALGFKPDAFLIHNPYVAAKGKLGELWQVLEGLVEDGTLEGVSLGVSNFRPQDFAEIFKVAKIKPALHQLEYHPYLLNHLEPVDAIHKEHGIVVQAYSPIAPVVAHANGGPLKPVLARVAERLTKETGKEVDPVGVLLSWLVGRGVVPITTATRPANIEKLSRIESLPPLLREEDEEIERLGRTIHWRSHPEHMWEDFPPPNLPDGL